ncbi:Peroxidase 72, partial [Linum perenne]
GMRFTRIGNQRAAMEATNKGASFRQRLYNKTGNGQPDYSLESSYVSQLKTRCLHSGGDQNLFFLDFQTLTHFDNTYLKNMPPRDC